MCQKRGNCLCFLASKNLIHSYFKKLLTFIKQTASNYTITPLLETWFGKIKYVALFNFFGRISTVLTSSRITAVLGNSSIKGKHIFYKSQSTILYQTAWLLSFAHPLSPFHFL